MEEKSQDNNKKMNNINHNEDLSKSIISNLIVRSVNCSKRTIDVTSKLIDSLMTQNKNGIISICEGGLPDDLPELRSLIWKINLGYLPLNTKEWDKILKSKRIAYQKYKKSVFDKLEEELKLFDNYDKKTKEEISELNKKTSKLLLEEICKDTNRTHSGMSFFNTPIDKKNKLTEKELIQMMENKRNCSLKDIKFTYKINIVLTHSDIIARILFIYSKFEPIISYVQGMNEILAPIYYCFAFDIKNDEQSMDELEADSFWCFYNLMMTLKVLFNKNADDNDIGISGKANKIKIMLQMIDKKLYEHIMKSGFEFKLLSFRWVSLLFSQDFDLIDTLRIWDYLLSADNILKNIYYFCIAVILQRKDKLMMQKVSGIYESLQNIKDLCVEGTIANAINIQKKYDYICKPIIEQESDQTKKKTIFI